MKPRNKKPKVKMICLQCGKVFFVSTYLSKVRKFCSTQCSSQNEDVRKRISQTVSRVQLGTKHTKEWNQHIADGNRGKPLSEERKEKIRQKRLVQKISKTSKLETKMQEELLKRNLPFVHNKHILNCIPDFSNSEFKIAIFCDGDYWHANPNKYTELDNIQEHNLSYDIKNNYTLKKNGWIVLRFWGTEINENISNCVDIIEKEFKLRTCVK